MNIYFCPTTRSVGNGNPAISQQRFWDYTLRRQVLGIAFGLSCCLAAPGMTKAASHLTVRGVYQKESGSGQNNQIASNSGHGRQ